MRDFSLWWLLLGPVLKLVPFFFGEPEGDSKLERGRREGGGKGPSDEQSTHAPNSLTGHCQAKSSSSSRREKEREGEEEELPSHSLSLTVPALL